MREGPVAATASTIGPGIPSADTEAFEIADVPSHDLKPMKECGGSNHSVFNQGIGSAMHDLRPDAERGRIHRQDVPGRGDLIRPVFDISRFCGILLARELNASLDFAE